MALAAAMHNLPINVKINIAYAKRMYIFYTVTQLQKTEQQYFDW